MTDNQWTPEPWKLGEVEGTIIADTFPPKCLPEARAAHTRYYGAFCVVESANHADIVRACACVNACKGISTTALEAGFVPKTVYDAFELAHGVRLHAPRLDECDALATKLLATLKGFYK